MVDEKLMQDPKSCLYRIRNILLQSRNKALIQVNKAMLEAYWEIGREIIEEEQKGADRAEYGKRLVKALADKLSKEFGKGLSYRNLWYMRRFYLSYKKMHAVRAQLSWTHIRRLSQIESEENRKFYEDLCIKEGWSTRVLDRQISSCLHERVSTQCLKTSNTEKTDLASFKMIGQYDFVKDPYILEFAGLNGLNKHSEKDLERALMEGLQNFLLELGKGFAFVGRQQRVTVGGDDYYIDLVFYHTILKCFVLLDLKTRKLTHGDLGQMQFYVNYYNEERRSKGDNPTIGIVLCTDKNEAMVKYTLGNENKHIFASRYKLYLPNEKDLAAELRRSHSKIIQSKEEGDG